MQELLRMVELKLNSSRREIEVLIPYSKYEAMSLIREKGMLLSEEHLDTGTIIKAYLDEAEIGQLKKILQIEI